MNRQTQEMTMTREQAETKAEAFADKIRSAIGTEPPVRVVPVFDGFKPVWQNPGDGKWREIR